MDFLKTLRGKLIVWQIGTVVVGLTLLMFFIGWSVYNVLLLQIDHHLHTVVSQAQQISIETEGEEQWRLLLNLVAGNGMVIVVNDRGMYRQLTSNDIVPLSDTEMANIIQESNFVGQHPTHFTHREMRYSTIKLTPTGNLLIVGYSVVFLQQLLSKLLLLTSLGSLLVILLVGLVNHLLLKRYLTPLENIAQTADDITSSQKLKIRIPEIPRAQTTTEVNTIRHAYNKLLAQLEHIFEKEHAFFSDAAHTLKTPLAVIRAKIENEDGLGEKKRSALLSLVDTANTAVSDLLLISRVETGAVGEQTQISLSSVIAELVELTEDLAKEKKLEITASIEPHLFISAEEHLLKRALSNLFHNAVDYSDESSHLTIRLYRSNEKAVLKIINVNSELTPAEIKKVFDRFFRGDQARQNTIGTGLGLSISQAIASHLGGTLSLTKVEKDKVSVTLTLPLIPS